MILVYNLSSGSGVYGWRKPIATFDNDDGDESEACSSDTLIKVAARRAGLGEGTYLIAVVWHDLELAVQRITVDQPPPPEPIVNILDRVKGAIRA